MEVVQHKSTKQKGISTQIWKLSKHKYESIKAQVWKYQGTNMNVPKHKYESKKEQICKYQRKYEKKNSLHITK